MQERRPKQLTDIQISGNRQPDASSPSCYRLSFFWGSRWVQESRRLSRAVEVARLHKEQQLLAPPTLV